MKRTLTFLLFLCCAAATGLGQAAENFNYPAGDSLSMKSGGAGFSDSWRLLKGNNQTSIGAGGIVVNALGAKTSGNHLSIKHSAGQNGARFFRKLAAPVADDGNVYFMSWVMETEFSDPATNGSVCQAMLVNSAAYAAAGPNGQLVRMGKIFNSEKFGIDGQRVGAVQLVADTDTRNADWVVVMIKMSGDADREFFYVFVDPVPNTALDSAQADYKFRAELNTGFDAIGGKLEGPATLNGRIDDLRFGASLQEVTPDDLQLVPVAAAEEFAYAFGDTLNGQSGGTGFGGPWQFRSGSSQANIAEKGTDIKQFERTTSSNSLFVDHTAGSSNARFFRLLKNPVTDDGETYYLSWVMDADYDSPSTNGSVFQAMIVKSAGFAASGPGGQTVRMGKIFNSEKFGVDGQRVGAAILADGTDTRDGYFAIAMLKMSGDAAREKMYVFINPDLNSTALDTASATLKFTVDLNDGFDAVGAKIEGPAAVNGRLDELRFSPNLPDVLPQNLTVTVPPNTILAMEKFAYNPVDSLNGLGKTGDGFAGSWIDLNGRNTAQIVNKGLVNEGLLVRTAPAVAAAQSTAEANRYVRYFLNPIDTNTTSIWFSVQMAANGAAAGNAASFLLIDSTKTGDNFQHVIIGKQFNTPNIIAAGNGQVGGASTTGRSFSGAAANWIVGNLNYTGGRWLLNMWVDPDPASQPAPENAQVKDKPYRSATFHGVGIRAEGGEGLQYLTDDIIIGKVYTDVVPLDLTPLSPRPGKVLEKFDYPVNAALEGLDGGAGFAGPYQLLAGQSPSVTATGVSSAQLLKLTSGNKLEVKPRQPVRMLRKLAGEYGDNGRDYWLGYFFNSLNGTRNVAHLVLADSSSYTATGAGGQLLQVGQVFGGSIGTVPGTAIPGRISGEGYFIAMHIVTNGSSAPDEVYLWVNPAVGTTPSRDTATKVMLDLSRWNSLGFKVEYAPDSLVTAVWDDIAIGNSFQDVVPADLTDIDPPVFPEVGYEGFEYEAGANLKDLDGGNGWGEAWRITSESDKAAVSASSIDSDRTNPKGNKLTIDQSGTPVAAARAFRAPIAATSGTFWASALIDVTRKDIGNAVHFVYVDGTGKDIAGFGGIQGISKFAFLDSELAAEVDQNTDLVGPKWMVIRMDIDEDAVDKVYMWLNPVADAIPDIANADYSLETQISGGVAGIRINSLGVQTAVSNIDEIRTGFAFRDVSSKFGSSDPDLIAYEPFNYDENASIIGAGGENAFWLNAWFDRGQGGDNVQKIVDGSLSIEGYESSGNRARLELIEAGKQIRIDRTLAEPIINDGSTYWMSFLMFSEDTPVKNQVGNITLKSSAVTSNDGQVIAFGRIYSTGNLGLITPQNNTATVTDKPDKGLSWIVVKIVTTGTSVNDSVYMWINPSPESEPDVTLADVVRETNAFKSPVDIVRLKNEGAGADQVPYNLEFDEIRIARTWQSAKLMTTSTDVFLPESFHLKVYPNPAQGEVNLEIATEKNGMVGIDLFNTTGQHLSRLINTPLSTGHYKFSWDLSHLENGLYFIRITDGVHSKVQKIILFK